jgi:hypothetical protein
MEPPNDQFPALKCGGSQLIHNQKVASSLDRLEFATSLLAAN